ncbi:MAG: ECF transporter S component [Candidatus Borkfalkiaceae bacterium]|nr:ECF transporter S component [Christensenellaceae bacterium]
MNNYFSTRKLCFVAMFTALNVIMSSFGIPVPGGHLYLNDVIICTAALVLDPLSAFIVGGVGAFLGDLFFYPAPMFVSLVTHGLQAAAISLIVGKKNGNPSLVKGIIAVTVGAIIMIAGYSLGRAFIYSTPEYAILKLPFQILQAAVGAVAGVLLVFRSPLKRFLLSPREE